MSTDLTAVRRAELCAAALVAQNMGRPLEVEPADFLLLADEVERLRVEARGLRDVAAAAESRMRAIGETCPKCNGGGSDDGQSYHFDEPPEPCPECMGIGLVPSGHRAAERATRRSILLWLARRRLWLRREIERGGSSVLREEMDKLAYYVERLSRRADTAEQRWLYETEADRNEAMGLVEGLLITDAELQVAADAMAPPKRSCGDPICPGHAKPDGDCP